MVKIKTKKQIDLPMLINWAWHNIENVEMDFLKTDNTNNYGNCNKINFSDENSTFYTDEVLDNELTVDVYVEITEDTVIPKLVVNHSDGGFTLYENDYINNEFPLDSVRAFYILNNDLTMTLIWKDGKLI